MVANHRLSLFWLLSRLSRYLKWRNPEPYYKAILGVGFPLHRPYLYSLYDGEDESILGTLLKFNSSPLKIYLPKMKGSSSNHHLVGGFNPIEKMLVKLDHLPR